jgi:hypothetical protein
MPDLRAKVLKTGTFAKPERIAETSVTAGKDGSGGSGFQWPEWQKKLDKKKTLKG